ncbi:MAG: VWA domain-containing protein [Candidatus Aminicenantaceae bacterium]
MKAFKYLILFNCWILIFGSLSIAQEIKHDVTVTVKLIQVYVMDKAGNPITDLRPEEFTIFDNNKLQKITEFEKYILFLSDDLKGPKPEQVEVEPLSSTDEVMNRKFFLFFDLANNNTKGFLKSQQAALHFLDNQVHPSDEIGVLSFSVLKGLTLHEYFTKDLDAIRSAVIQLGKAGRVGRADNFEALIWRELEGQSALDASQPSMPIKNPHPAHLGSRSQKGGIDDPAPNGGFEFDHLWKRAQFKSITRILFTKLTALSKALRNIPGNKYILFFSSGTPYSLMYGISSKAPISMQGTYGLDRFLMDRYEEMLKELSNANTAVFSLNTESLIEDINVPSHMKGEDTLRKISQDTGGKFLGNVQNYADNLDTVQKFTGSYYVLGYYVGESYDGRYHNIKVRVSRPGCKVFAQRGYFNPKMFSRYSDMEKEIHLIDLALSERPLLQTPLDIPMNAIPCPLEGEQGICLLARIPGEKIREKIGKDAEIFFLVFDEKDNIVELKRRKVEQSALKGKEALYYSLLPLPHGTYKTSIVMRDMQTGESAVGRDKVEIPKIQEQGLQLLSPLLLAPGKTDLYIRGYVPKSIKANFPLLYYFPFDPEQYAPFFGEIPKNTQKLQAVLCCYMRNLARPVLKFEAALIENSSGHESSLPVSILFGTKEGEEAKLLAEFTMPELTAGEYILRITAFGSSSQARSQTAVSFWVY